MHEDNNKSWLATLRQIYCQCRPNKFYINFDKFLEFNTHKIHGSLLLTKN